MIDNYKEAKNYIDEIRLKKGEILFRMAISHLVDVGIRHLNEENVNETCVEIMKQDDTNSFMTNEYQCEIVKTAYELTKVSHIALLKYIGKFVEYDI